MSTLFDGLVECALKLNEGTQRDKLASTFIMTGAVILMMGPEHIEREARAKLLDKMLNEAECLAAILGKTITDMGAGTYVDPVELVDLDGKLLHQ